MAASSRDGLGESKSHNREGGNPRGLFDAGLADLDDLLCDHLGEGIVAILEAESLQGLVIGRGRSLPAPSASSVAGGK
jgi:hypothetical protein